MTGDGDNSLTLRLDDLLDVSPATVGHLIVDGNAGDSVIATGFADTGTNQMQDGVTYDVYSHAGSPDDELWAAQALTVLE
ncbi:hypothetical protein SPBRAN_1630 [uncultured Candidatus Thioglobus sp.]|nr:hypothetical protein SPBRAN_1630 [uncultured Candidatus Thioglobus sp.]